MGKPQPQRIQLKRTKGWRMPANTVKVDRSTRWGNPFRKGELLHWDMDEEHCFEVDVRTVAEAVEYFRRYASLRNIKDRDWLKPLRGKELACWCKPGNLCHADVLLEIANATEI